MADVANFKDLPIGNSERPDFHRFVRKVVAMEFLAGCSMCGSRRRPVKPYWSLTMRMCIPCVRANVISNKVLLDRYGIGMMDQYQGSTLAEMVSPPCHVAWHGM